MGIYAFVSRAFCIFIHFTIYMILSLKINRKFKCVATNATFYGYIHDEQWTWSSESVLLEYFQLDQSEGFMILVSQNIILPKLVLGVSWHVSCLPLISRLLCLRWIFMLVLILLGNPCWIFKLTGAQRTFGDFHPIFHVLVTCEFCWICSCWVNCWHGQGKCWNLRRYWRWKPTKPQGSERAWTGCA